VAESQYDPDEYRTSKDAAKLLGVSPKTIQLWVESGVLRAWKTAGGHRRITLESIMQLVERRRDAVRGAHEPVPWRMLVVEDEPMLQRLYEININAWKLPLELKTTRDGFEALVQIGEQMPDILISDLRMPGMDGFQMLYRLQEMGLLQKMLVIVVSAFDASDIHARGGLPAGVQRFAKPVPFDELRRLIQHHLSHQTDFAGIRP
jgi:excisionase family DNA binding protein